MEITTFRNKVADRFFKYWKRISKWKKFCQYHYRIYFPQGIVDQYPEKSAI